MADRLRALKGLSYPATAEALALVRAAGGLRNVSPDVRADLPMKDVAAGDWCDDVPEESRETLLASGDIELVPEADAAAKRKRA